MYLAYPMNQFKRERTGALSLKSSEPVLSLCGENRIKKLRVFPRSFESFSSCGENRIRLDPKGRFDKAKRLKERENLLSTQTKNVKYHLDVIFCGENRIRTCEPVLPVTRFPGVPLQPLEHLSLRKNWMQRYDY